MSGSGWFWIEKHAFIGGFSQGSTLNATLFILYTNNFCDHNIFNISIYADETAVNSKCDQAIYVAMA